MYSEWLKQNIRCPTDRFKLTESNNELVCEAGHRFPVVDDVPVLLVEDAAPTFHVSGKSLKAARDNVSGRAESLFLDTVGIDDEQRRAILGGAASDTTAIDPVVNYLVAHTNGILYKHLVGRLESYPIPEIGLPSGNGNRLLDAGCSWGRWCIAAARKGYRPVGIDPSLGAVLAGRRVAQSLGATVDWVVGDARRLPFSSSVFDVVYSYSVLQHLSDDDATAAFAEIARVLTDNGSAHIQLANRYGMRSLYHQARRGFRTPRGFEVRYRSPSAMKKMFQSVGLHAQVGSDCYFGLGLQKADAKYMPLPKRFLISVSEILKKASRYIAPLRLLADSLFVVGSPRA